MPGAQSLFPRLFLRGVFQLQFSDTSRRRRTGNLTFISDRAVHKVIVDEATGKAAGVEIVDTQDR